MSTPSAQEIQALQGTRLSSTAPWESYESEMAGPKMSNELAVQVAEYAQTQHKGPTSSQSQEVLAENKEINDALAKQYQWLQPGDYADVEARIGRVMSHAEFITLLRKAGVTCFYREHPHPDKLTLLWQPHGVEELEVAGWVQYGMMPELSIMNFDAHGVPLAERRRGWRTPVLQLILKGILTEEKADKVFGKPRSDAAYAKYNSTLKAFRDAGSSLD